MLCEGSYKTTQNGVFLKKEKQATTAFFVPVFALLYAERWFLEGNQIIWNAGGKK